MFMRRAALLIGLASIVALALVTGWWDQAVTWLQVHLVNQSQASL